MANRLSLIALILVSISGIALGQEPRAREIVLPADNNAVLTVGENGRALEKQESEKMEKLRVLEGISVPIHLIEDTAPEYLKNLAMWDEYEFLTPNSNNNLAELNPYPLLDEVRVHVVKQFVPEANKVLETLESLDSRKENKVDPRFVIQAKRLIEHKNSLLKILSRPDLHKYEERRRLQLLLGETGRRLREHAIRIHEARQ